LTDCTGTSSLTSTNSIARFSAAARAVVLFPAPRGPIRSMFCRCERPVIAAPIKCSRSDLCRLQSVTTAKVSGWMPSLSRRGGVPDHIPLAPRIVLAQPAAH
jgi:hypothetical protein